MPFQLLKDADYRRMPWKNGLGVTVEIALFPANATLETFGWRVSMASVAEDGAFSAFPDIDRSLAVLRGDGLSLTVGDAPPVHLVRQSPAHRFPADQPTLARLAGSAVEDLNVMTRRGHFEHRVEAVGDDRALLALLPAETFLLFCLDGGAEGEDDKETFAVKAGETLVRGPEGYGASLAVHPEPGSRLYAITLRPLRQDAD